MGNIEFTVQPNALSVIKNISIDANFDEVKAALTDFMAPYQGMVVSEDGIAAAKSDRARIRKVADGIDDVRKNIKKIYTEPLTVFENRCKELVSICKSGADNLDKQIKAYDEKTADEKLQRLFDYYKAFRTEESDFSEEREILTWEAIVDPRWRNKGFAESDAQTAISDRLQNVRDDLEAIRSMDQQDVPYLLSSYKERKDFHYVLRLAQELKTRRAVEAQRAAEAKKRDQKEPDIPVRQPIAAESANVDSESRSNTEADDLIMHEVVFRVRATRKQIAKLRLFLNSNNIYYERA